MGHAETSPNMRVIVARPRAGDAVGASLRDAFGRDPALPDEMAMLLSRLNGNGGLHH